MGAQRGQRGLVVGFGGDVRHLLGVYDATVGIGDHDGPGEQAAHTPVQHGDAVLGAEAGTER
ncbi:hypothetical protein SDC9_170589 [bioreactor metagenome]|uniref:Uncharacterized protein n=1 Tax=bioreactor metagenome TaxID=1076179 RepID=A0A645G8G6_9ZZZZ